MDGGGRVLRSLSAAWRIPPTSPTPASAPRRRRRRDGVLLRASEGDAPPARRALASARRRAFRALAGTRPARGAVLRRRRSRRRCAAANIELSSRKTARPRIIAGARPRLRHHARSTISGCRAISPSRRSSRRPASTPEKLAAFSSMSRPRASGSRQRRWSRKRASASSIRIRSPSPSSSAQPFALWQKDGQVSLVAADGTPIDELRATSVATCRFVVGEGANAAVGGFLALLDAPASSRQDLRAGVLVGGAPLGPEADNGLDVKLPEADPARGLARSSGLQREFRCSTRDLISLDLRVPGRSFVRLDRRSRGCARRRAREQEEGAAPDMSFEAASTPRLRQTAGRARAPCFPCSTSARRKSSA